MRRRHVRVVEIPDDGVGRPADGHQVQEARHGEHDAGDAGDAGLEAADADALGALDAHHAQGQRHAAQHDGEHREAARRLHVAGQGEHAVVHLALDLPRALHDAGHPEALPDDLSRHDVVPDEGGDAPQRHGAHDRPTHPAHDGHDQAQQLHTCGRHGDRCCLNPTEAPGNAELEAKSIYNKMRRRRVAKADAVFGGGQL